QMAAIGEHALGPLLGIHREVWVTALTIAITVPLVVLVGDMTPKTLAIKMGERWARRVARVLDGFAWLLSPIRVVGRLVADGLLFLLGARLATQEEGIREEEFRALVDVGEKEGEVEVAERRLIHNVFEFGDRTVGEVMTRGDKVFALPYDMPLGRLV